VDRKARKPSPPAPRPKVIHLTQEHVLRRTAKSFLDEPAFRCSKCSSTYVNWEPAFVHCRHCGKLARVARASLVAQEEFEMRSGLRSAS
jgi:hypothetical protein